MNKDGSRVGFNPSAGTFPWRRAWKPTPVFLPGKSHGQRSLVGYSPWCPDESDTNEATEHTRQVFQGVCVGEAVGVKALGRDEGTDGLPGGQGGEPCQEGQLGRAWKRAQGV